MDKKKKKKGGIFRGTPVIGARSSAKLKTRSFKSDGKGEKFTRLGRFKTKGKAKSMKKDLEKIGRDAKITKRSVRTRGGGPKIETSFSVYQKEGDK